MVLDDLGPCSTQPDSPRLDGLFPIRRQQAYLSYLDYCSWWRVARWLRKRHKQPSWKRLRRRELKNWEIGEGGQLLFRPSRVPVERYRYRGARIPSPWDTQAPSILTRARTDSDHLAPTEVMESRMRGNVHVQFGGRGAETD
jgi:hypothetical protein